MHTEKPEIYFADYDKAELTQNKMPTVAGVYVKGSVQGTEV